MVYLFYLVIEKEYVDAVSMELPVPLLYVD